MKGLKCGVAFVMAVLAASVAWGDLINGGFETNSGSGGSADWWSDAGAAGTENWANHSGSWGMAIVGWSGSTGSFQQDSSGAEDFTYTFSIWGTKDVNFEAGTVDLMLEWYDAGSGFLGSVTNAIYANLDSTWQQFSVVGVAPTNTVTVRALVDSTGITAGGAGKFDDATLAAAIPEPSVLALLGVAVGSLLCILRRRSK